jgi:hypothetical protein
MDVTVAINKHKNLILNVLVIILSLFIANIVYKKQVQMIELLKENNAIEIKKNEISESISKSEQKINTYKNLLARKDAGLMVNSIGNIAKDLGIKIITMRPIRENRYSDYIKLPFNLIINVSDYHRLGKFISRIENNVDVYAIDTIQIQRDSQTKELNVNLVISSIIFKN